MGNIELNSRHIALLIGIFAAVLGLVEMGADARQNTLQARTLDLMDTITIFQAKTVREAELRNSIAMVAALTPESASPARRQQIAGLLGKWSAEASQLSTDPKSGSGRKELADKSKRLAAERVAADDGYRTFQLGERALQLSIVLAAISLFAGITQFAIGAAIVGAYGVVLGAIGWIAPSILHSIVG